MSKPVVTFPGKIGDLIMAVPSMMRLRELYGEPVHLVTTPYCAPAVELLLKRTGDLFSDIMINPSYRATSQHLGVQPDYVEWRGSYPDDGRHADVFHLGIVRMPAQGETLVESIGYKYGLVPRKGPWLTGIRSSVLGRIIVAADWSAKDAPGWAPGLMLRLKQLSLRRVSIVFLGTKVEVAAHRAIPELSRLIPSYVVQSLEEFAQAIHGASLFVGLASAMAVTAAAAGMPCEWYMRPGGDERWVPPGCEVKLVNAPHVNRTNGIETRAVEAVEVAVA